MHAKKIFIQKKCCLKNIISIKQIFINISFFLFSFLSLSFFYMDVDGFDNSHPNLYVVLTVNASINTSIIIVNKKENEKIHVDMLYYKIAHMSMAAHTKPDMARLREFTNDLIHAMHRICTDHRLRPKAILVREPPSTPLHRIFERYAAKASEAKSTVERACRQLAERTSWINFVCGALYGLYPSTPTWFISATKMQDAIYTKRRITSARGEEEAAEKYMCDISGHKMGGQQAVNASVAVYHYKKFVAKP